MKIFITMTIVLIMLQTMLFAQWDTNAIPFQFMETSSKENTSFTYQYVIQSVNDKDSIPFTFSNYKTAIYTTQSKVDINYNKDGFVVNIYENDNHAYDSILFCDSLMIDNIIWYQVIDSPNKYITIGSNYVVFCYSGVDKEDNDQFIYSLIGAFDDEGLVFLNNYINTYQDKKMRKQHRKLTREFKLKN